TGVQTCALPIFAFVHLVWFAAQQECKFMVKADYALIIRLDHQKASSATDVSYKDIIGSVVGLRIFRQATSVALPEYNFKHGRQFMTWLQGAKLAARLWPNQQLGIYHTAPVYDGLMKVLI